MTCAKYASQRRKHDFTVDSVDLLVASQGKTRTNDLFWIVGGAHGHLVPYSSVHSSTNVPGKGRRLEDSQVR